MTTPTDIEYALMAGAAYISNRDPQNQFPAPQDWKLFFHVPNNPDYPIFTGASGFEAVSFQSKANPNDIVISFAGTNPYSADQFANLGLATGAGSDQLLQVVDYYLAVKASAPVDANITFTGHSLGGGIAALMGVFFGKQAVTFDQAPFAKTAAQGLLGTASYALDLQTYLIGKTITDPAQNATRNNLVADLGSFLSLQQTNGGIPNSDLVSTYRVTGEFTSSGIIGTLLNPIGAPASFIQHGPTNISPITELHSQALLTAFLQSGDTSTSTVADHTLGQVTYKLTDLLGMIFDKNLYYNDPNNKNNPQRNFLENLVRHQAGVRDPVTDVTTIAADAMVTRFTTDLWQIAQAGGLTMNDKNITDALIAFAMQSYYEGANANDTTGTKHLFTSIAGGLEFAITDVGKSGTLNDAKGYSQYFVKAISDNTDPNFTYLTNAERTAIKSLLPALQDWYIQAGTTAMYATDTFNLGAFMLGGAGNDILTGSAGNDLLVGGAGNDTLIGGTGCGRVVAQQRDPQRRTPCGYNDTVLLGRSKCEAANDAEGGGCPEFYVNVQSEGGRDVNREVEQSRFLKGLNFIPLWI